MIPLATIFSNSKNILLIAAVIVAVWFYKDYQFQKSENARQSENFASKVKEDSTHYSEQLLSKQQLLDYLEYDKKELLQKLNESGIKKGRIESITTNNYYYQDTIKRATDVSPLISSIKNDIPNSQPFIDTTKCQTTKGNVIFDGKTLKVEVSDREFKNTSESVGYWERRQWNFLGIKTRLFGKIQMTAKTFDDCGQSTTVRVEKMK